MPVAKRARIDTTNPATPLSAAAPLPASNGAAACMTPLSLAAAPLQFDVLLVYLMMCGNNSSKYLYKNELDGLYRYFVDKNGTIRLGTVIHLHLLFSVQHSEIRIDKSQSYQLLIVTYNNSYS